MANLNLVVQDAGIAAQVGASFAAVACSCMQPFFFACVCECGYAGQAMHWSDAPARWSFAALTVRVTKPNSVLRGWHAGAMSVSCRILHVAHAGSDAVIKAQAAAVSGRSGLNRSRNKENLQKVR